MQFLRSYLTLRLLGKRKREGDDEAQPSPSGQLRGEVEVETFVGGEGSSLNGGSLATISSNTAVMAVSASRPSESSSKSTQAAQHSANTPSSALFPIRNRKAGLTTLYEPENNSSAIVDVVFVHGLTGDAYNTWLYQHGKTKTYWPYELLPKDIPDARILAFGYDADVTQFWGPASSNRVGNHAENMLGDLSRLRAKTDTEHRKLIFVAHSLGGLVTQCALFMSKSSPEVDIQLLEEYTIGLAFLGTPHHGSDYAAWVTFATNLTSWIKRSNRDIVAVLEPQSEVLANIQKGFHGILSRRMDAGNKISVTCFYEELSVTGVGDIVSKHSATLPQYASYGIHANHMNMTKFDSAGNEGYKTVEGEIFKWVKNFRRRDQQISSGDLHGEFRSKLDFQSISKRRGTIDAVHPNSFDGILARHNLQPRPSLRSGESAPRIADIAGSGESLITRCLTDAPDQQLSVRTPDCEPDPISTTLLDHRETTHLPLVNVHSTPQSSTRKEHSSLMDNCQKLARFDLDQHVQSIYSDTKNNCTYPSCHNNHGKGFLRMRALISHIRSTHLKDESNCPFPRCNNNKGKGFLQQNLISHIQSAHLHSTHNCSFTGCDNNMGKGFSNYPRLSCHVRKFHLYPESNCLFPGCDNNNGNGFSLPKGLAGHIKAVHSDVRYNCSFDGCNNNMGKGFSQQKVLADHIKAVHSDVRYNCSFDGCDNNNGKGFSRPKVLASHIKTVHSDVRYNCSFDGCNNNMGKGFSQRKGLAGHIKAIHPITES